MRARARYTAMVGLVLFATTPLWANPQGRTATVELDVDPAAAVTTNIPTIEMTEVQPTWIRNHWYKKSIGATNITVSANWEYLLAAPDKITLTHPDNVHTESPVTAVVSLLGPGNTDDDGTTQTIELTRGVTTLGVTTFIEKTWSYADVAGTYTGTLPFTFTVRNWP